MNTTYDAIVIGSGISGGWAAKELTQKGLKTLVLEAGRSIDPVRDYDEHVPSWDLKFNGLGDRLKSQAEQPIQRTSNYAVDEFSSKFFVNDKENPYTTDPGKPFVFIRGRQVGGRSITWGRQSYRRGDLDFGENLKDGFGTDWPFRYKDISPWYDYVEKFIGVSGRAAGIPHLTDGIFLPPTEMTCVEEHVRDGLASHYGKERMLIIARNQLVRDGAGYGAAVRLQRAPNTRRDH